MRKFCLWIALTLAFVEASAQTISHNAIASNGGSFANIGCQLSFTVGETIVATFSSENNVLTQGFQQTELLIDGSSLLNKEVVTFDAFAEYRTAKLIWVTNTSFKTDFIVLERINNTTGQFETLEHRNVFKDKHDLTNYPFTDSDPQDGDNYYRVKQVFYDGLFRYSDDRKVTFLSADKVSLFPNPADDNVNIDISSYLGKDVTISIFSELGELKLTRKVEHVGKQPLSISLNDMESGHYQVRIDVQGKRNVVKQLIITK